MVSSLLKSSIHIELDFVRDVANLQIKSRSERLMSTYLGLKSADWSTQIQVETQSMFLLAG